MPGKPTVPITLDALRTKKFQKEKGLFAKVHQGKDIDVRHLAINQRLPFGCHTNALIHVTKKSKIVEQVKGGYTSFMVVGYKPPKRPKK